MSGQHYDPLRLLRRTRLLEAAGHWLLSCGRSNRRRGIQDHQRPPRPAQRMGRTTRRNTPLHLQHARLGIKRGHVRFTWVQKACAIRAAAAAANRCAEQYDPPGH